MAYRKRKEAGKVSHSVAMQHTGAVRILTQPIIEGIHYGIDHLPRVRRHGFGQSNCLRSLRVSPSQWDHGARVSRWRGYPRSTFLHRMRGACCCFECTRSGSACATSASSCPADSTRAAPQKTRGTRDLQMSKLRIHACHYRRAWLFDYMGLLGRRQHRKPLRQMRL